MIFFGFVRLFFECLQRVHHSILFYFAKEWMLENSQRPPFTFFGTMRLTGDQEKFREKNSKKFGIFFHFFPHAGTVEENT